MLSQDAVIDKVQACPFLKNMKEMQAFVGIMSYGGILFSI